MSAKDAFKTDLFYLGSEKGSRFDSSDFCEPIDRSAPKSSSVTGMTLFRVVFPLEIPDEGAFGGCTVPSAEFFCVGGKELNSGSYGEACGRSDLIVGAAFDCAPQCLLRCFGLRERRKL
jgi:hypothetical protein